MTVIVQYTKKHCAKFVFKREVTMQEVKGVLGANGSPTIITIIR